MTLYRWSVPCITEGIQVVSDYTSIKPTVCPNNNTHTIDAAGIVALDALPGPNEVYINPGGLNNKYYMVIGYGFNDAPASVTTNFDFTNYFAVVPKSFCFQTESDNVGDVFSLYLNPDTLIGVATSIPVVGSNIISAASNILSQIIPGFLLSLSDGTNKQIMGLCYKIDNTNLQITTEIPVSVTFTTAPQILISIPRVYKLPITNTQPIIIGYDNFISSDIPENTVIRLAYTNNSTVDKKFSFYVANRFGLNLAQ